MSASSSPHLLPDLSVERSLLGAAGAGAVLIGFDEVGRGCLAGPVAVGAVLVDCTTADPPPGLRDSKLLSAARRTALVPLVHGWARRWSVGFAGAAEIDELGILAALRLAAERAVASMPDALECPVVALVDGSYDWLQRPTPSSASPLRAGSGSWSPTVVTRVRADQACASVAAASVLAKTQRDAHMQTVALRFDGYGFARNVGYGTAEHLGAIARLGLTDEHRRSWRIPVISGGDPGTHRVGGATGAQPVESVGDGGDRDDLDGVGRC